jgi:hypothetical protein
VFSIVALILIFEPLWRMRAVTALGMAISARTSSVGSAALAAGVAVVAFWIVQLILLFLVVFVGLIVSPIYLFPIVRLVFLPLFVALVSAIFYGLYVVTTRWSLRSAVRRLIADERATSLPVPVRHMLQ